MNSPRLDPTTWLQIEGYLDHALDLEPDARETWLAELSNTQPAIARMVRDLVIESEALDARGFLEGSPMDAAGLHNPLRSPKAGQRAGAYVIERLLGRGGMGEVWLASRSDGRFEGHCAIKFLDGTIEQSTLAERFRREGGLLARLGHPHIARLLDAGTTDDGRQFLAIEYVDGERIDGYCDTHKLDVRQRVRLFLDTAAAVAFAHGNLIIHRDLKPANVLVTREGVSKLLDFGIAKLLNTQSAANHDTPTRIEEAALTPEYAAPEQLMGDMPSAATDVYQLGMLLYVLLTGRHHLGHSASRAERIKAALESRVPLASSVAGAATRTELRGDLDAILAMALQTEPGSRYATAAAFRDDLVRYLNREPVNARHGTPIYHARRFVARHRLVVSFCAAAVVALCAALAFALTQAHVATTERDRAISLSSRNAAVTDFLGMLITEAAEADKPVTVKDMLGRSEQLALADASGSRENRAAVLAMIADRYSALGNDGRAAWLLKSALSLTEASPDKALRARLICANALADSNGGHIAAAANAIHRELDNLKSDPETAARCLLDRSIIAVNMHDARGALQYAKQGYERFRAAPRRAAADEALFLAAIAFGNHLNGRNRETDRYYQLALNKYAELGRQQGPDAINLRNNWAVAINEAGLPERALRLYDDSLSIAAQRDPGSDPPAYLVGNRARALDSMGRYDEAQAAYDLECRLVGEQHDLFGQAHCLLGLASLTQKRGDGRKAAEYLDRVARLLKPAVPAGAPPWMAMAIVQGRIDLAAGRFDSARNRFAEALMTESNSASAIAGKLGLAEAQLLAGDTSAAVTTARDALGVAQSLRGDLPYSDQEGMCWLLLGRALQSTADQRGAHEAYANAVANLSNTVDAIHPALVRAGSLLAANETTRLAEH
jgi:serine/threonine-protein kinase